MPTRTFSAEELEGFGVPFECDGSEGTAIELHNELYDTTRWAHIYEFVFRAPDDGKAYRIYYFRGATEHQEHDLWGWEDQIEAIEVEHVETVTYSWKPKKETE